jgi:hypothetical protein
VEILPFIDVESGLACLVRDGVKLPSSKHHLAAPHEVIHRVFQTGYQSLLVDLVEVDDLVRGNLHALIALDEVDETPMLQLVVLHPVQSFDIVMGHLHLLEKSDHIG